VQCPEFVRFKRMEWPKWVLTKHGEWGEVAA
jgi:hypothetical protein